MMKIKEFLQLKDVTGEDFIKEHVKEVYLPVAEKYNLSDIARAICTEEDEETGYTVVNTMYRKIIPLHLILLNYTDFELKETEEIVETYDLICEFKHTPAGKILYNITDYIDDAQELYNMMIEEINNYADVKNDIRYTIKNALHKITSQIPSGDEMNELIDKTKSTFDGMSTKKLNGILGVINKITPQDEPKKDKKE